MRLTEHLVLADAKMWNASRFCVSSLRRGHANLLCIVPILVYVLPKQVHLAMENFCTENSKIAKLRLTFFCQRKLY